TSWVNTYFRFASGAIISRTRSAYTRQIIGFEIESTQYSAIETVSPRSRNLPQIIGDYRHVP
ncbi:MAG: hypothetical protein ACRC62_18200, partial [Microcoleus sp.]